MMPAATAAAAAAAKSLQSCPTLCDPIDGSPSGSPVPGILQARTLQWVNLHVVSEVAQSCLTLCDSMDCSPPGSLVHGIFQAWILEWVAISFSRGSSQPRNRTQASRIAGRRFTIWATREAVILEPPKIKPFTVSFVSPSICHEVMGLDATILVFWMLNSKPAFSLSSFNKLLCYLHSKALKFILPA